MRLLYSICVWAAAVLFTAGTAVAESRQETSGKRAGGDEGGGEHLDLAPGETVSITLEATSDPFDTWSAHPEVGGRGGEGEPVATAVESASWGHIKASAAQ